MLRSLLLRHLTAPVRGVIRRRQKLLPWEISFRRIPEDDLFSRLIGARRWRGSSGRGLCVNPLSRQPRRVQAECTMKEHAGGEAQRLPFAYRRHHLYVSLAHFLSLPHARAETDTRTHSHTHSNNHTQAHTGILQC